MSSERVQRTLRTLVAQLDLKLLALFLAVVVFYTVRDTIGHSTTVTMPVEVDVEDDRLAILNVDPLAVRVTFRGALAELRQLVEKDMAVVVRPRSMDAAGAESISIRAREIRGRAGNRVVGIDPSFVRVTYDRQGERELPVGEPTVAGRPLRGRVEIEYEPRTVQVRGAVRQLDQLIAQHVQLQTEPIDVEGRVQSFSRRVRVMPPEDTWLTGITPPEINVKVNIVTETVVREIDDVRVVAVMLPDTLGEVQITPPTVTLRLSGRSDVVQRVVKETAMVFVDGRQIVAGTPYELPLQVYLPPGITVETATVEPRTVRLTVIEPEKVEE